MSDILDATRWVVATLAGDATLASLAKVYSGIAPAGVAYPHIIVLSTSPHDELTFNANKIRMTDIVAVRAVCEGESYAPLEAIADRVYTLLHQQSGPVPTKTTRVAECFGLEPIMYPEFDDTTSKSYRHLGHLYQLSVVED